MHATVNRTEKTRPFALAVLLVIVLLGTALRLYELDADSLWLDEIFTSTRAQLDLPTLLSRLDSGVGRGVQLPLTYVVSHFFVAHFGTSEFVVRLPAMLVGSLSVLLIYKVGEMLWSRHVGLVGALLLAINPYHVQYSQEARHYALMVFLALMSLIFLIKALQRNGLVLWFGFVLSTSLGLYNHYFAFLFLPAEVFLAAWLIGEKWWLRRGKQDGRAQPPPSPGPTAAAQLLALSLNLAIVGASLLPWASPILGVVSSPAGSGAAGLSLDGVQSSLRLMVNVPISFSGVEGLWLAAWLGLFALGLARSSAKATALVLLGVGLPFAFLAAIGPEHEFMPRYILSWLPLYLLAVARGLLAFAALVHRHLLRPIAERRWSSATTQAFLALLFAALSLAPLSTYYPAQKEDWRSATAYLLHSMGAADVIIADGQGYGQGADAGRALNSLAYYSSTAGASASVFRAEGGLVNRLDEVPDHGAAAWGVLWHIDDLPDQQQIDSGFDVIEFPEVAVIRPVAPQGDLLADTLSLLETLVLLQPRPSGRIDLHLALAEIYLREGNQAEARHQAELAAAAARAYQSEAGPDPHLANGYRNLGTILEELGRPHRALAAYQEAVRLNPAEERTHVALGTIYRHLNEPLMAVAAYQQALDIEPTNAIEYFLLGEAHLQTGAIDEAVLAYEHAVQIEPDHLQARRRLDMLSRAREEDVPSPLFRTLGFEMALLGYNLGSGTASPGATIEVTLWWLALARMDKDYTAFVHLTDAEDRLCAQDDRVLEHNGRVTSAWRVAQWVKEEYRLELPPDIPPGSYTVQAGLYDWETGERLPVRDIDTGIVTNDTIPLGSVTVVD